MYNGNQPTTYQNYYNQTSGPPTSTRPYMTKAPAGSRLSYQGAAFQRMHPGGDVSSYPMFSSGLAGHAASTAAPGQPPSPGFPPVLNYPYGGQQPQPPAQSAMGGPVGLAGSLTPGGGTYGVPSYGGGGYGQMQPNGQVIKRLPNGEMSYASKPWWMPLEMWNGLHQANPSNQMALR